MDYTINFADAVTQNSYLWAYGSGFGGFWNLAWRSTDISSDFYSTQPANSVFNAFLGSFSVDWSRTDGLLRSVLANDGYRLVSLWTGFPNEPTTNTSTAAYDLMGSGGTIGDTYLTAQNRGEIPARR